MKLTFAFDQLIEDHPIPNLVKNIHSIQDLKHRDLDNQWPRIVSPRVLMYLDQANILYDVQDSVTAPAGSFYLVNFGWFDFSIDYFELMPASTKHRIKNQELRLVFIYHEGDNPSRIRSRLDQISRDHGIDQKLFLLISANTAAEWEPGCLYFDDHERFFCYNNRHQSINSRWCCDKKTYDFTLLNRRNKWWRAAVTADLHRHGILSNSLWSYDTSTSVEDSLDETPLSVFEIPGLYDYIQSWSSLGPYRCDETARDQQHRFGHINTDLYLRSWFHLVVESQYDVDQSGGTFITEKTYKCIKYGQPFVIIGPAGTLKKLRSHGYRVFDTVLDNSHDDIQDNNQRWAATKKLIVDMKQRGLSDLWRDCQDDVAHNMKIFHDRLLPSLNNFVREMHEYFSQ
jgi:hypothetical protein